MPRLAACCLVILAGLLPGGVLAGPWGRDAGAVFLSLSAERDRDGNSYASLYGEYGLSRRNTLGFELGRSDAGESSAMLWWQRTLDGGEGPDRVTVSTGLGALERDGEVIPLAQVGAAWGRGFDSIPMFSRVPGGGWLAVDARVKIAGAMKEDEEIRQLAGQGAGILSYITPETTSKADLTLGWHAMESLMLVNQLRLEDREDTGFGARLAVSAVGDLMGPAKLELGMIAPLSGQGEHAVKIGTWFEF